MSRCKKQSTAKTTRPVKVEKDESGGYSYSFMNSKKTHQGKLLLHSTKSMVKQTAGIAPRSAKPVLVPASSTSGDFA